MKLSHSKLSCILSCPMTYFLTYKMGLSLKIEKPALTIGSAVHWGIEHDTADLSEYYKQQGTFRQIDNYTDDQLLAEAMVAAYLRNKEDIFNEILTDKESKKKLTLLEEDHELYLTGKLKSFKRATDHDFVGIIDLLLLTDKGFIIIDYKTSSRIPNWDDYLDQIYRYIFLLRSCFPDVPIAKLGIVNLRKTAIRKKKNENDMSFRKRLQLEYELNDNSYITTHMFNPEKLDKMLLEAYINNLSIMADTAELIDANRLWYTNYSAANGQYGKSAFWDIFYNTPSNFLLYNISDTIFDIDSGNFLNKRDCREIDITAIANGKVLNKYDKFESQLRSRYPDLTNLNKATLFKQLSTDFIVDNELLNLYWETFTRKSTHEGAN